MKMSSANAVVSVLTVTVGLFLLLCPFVIGSESSQSPVLQVSPDSQKVRENGVASIQCIVSGDGAGQFRDFAWFRQDRRLTDRNPKYMIVNMTHGSVLRIFPVQKKDGGQYECRATDVQRETVVKIAELGVYAEGRLPPGFPQIRDLTTKVIEKNHNDLLQCIASGDPIPTITWLKEYLPLDLTNTRIKALPGGKLQIEKAQEADIGKYECIAANEAGVAHSNGVYVYVKERQVPPQFSRPPEDVEVKPGGSVNLTCVAIGSPMPYIKWLHGAVDLTPEGSLPPIGINILRLHNITESTIYTCEASSTLGVISAQSEIKLKDLPKPPVDVELVEATSESVTISWSSGNDDVTETYNIRYWIKSSQDDIDIQVTEVTDTEYTVQALVPHTTYQFQLVAVNSIGMSAPSEMVEATTREAAPTSPPRNVRARSVSSSTIVVQWDEPTRPNGKIKGYKIYYTLSPEYPLSMWRSVEIDNSLVTTISNLQTNRTYSIQVLAFTGFGNGPLSEAITIVTHQGVPDQPGNIRGTPLSATSIELSWEPSEFSIGNIDSYDIFGTDIGRKRNFTINVSPPRTNYVVENLSPNTRYIFKVAAKSSRGLGPLSASVMVATMEAAPSAAPQKVTGEAVDSTTIRVSWSPPLERDRNGLITGFRVRYAVGSEDAVIASVPATDQSYIMTNLRKWTPYRIAVLAHTEHGDGPYSETITVYTAEDVPGEPRRVGLEVINSTAVGITWRAPVQNERNGIIRGYQIFYVSMDGDADDDGQGQLDLLNIMDGNETRAVVGGLMPDTEYQFQIAAYTRKGDGERSRSKKIRTKAAAPKNFKVSLVSSNPPAVVGTWDRPLSGASRITGYRLEHRRVGSDGWNQRHLPADAVNFVSANHEKLLNGIEYEWRIAAKVGHDLGESVIQSVFIPEVVPSGSPINLKYSILTETSAKLQWDPPTLGGHDSALYYEISYRSDDDLDDEVQIRNSSEKFFIVEGLKTSTDYFFQISACSVGGCAAKSEALLVELVAPDLIRLEDIQASHTAADEITVSWKRPEVPPGLLLEYIVYHSTNGDLDVGDWLNSEPTSSLDAVLQYLDPDVAYYVMVRAKLTDDVFGPLSEVTEVKSDFDIHSVRDFHATVEGLTSVRLDWSPPKKTGLISYKIEYEGRYQTENGSEAFVRDALVVSRDDQRRIIDRLRPDTVYVFNISAKFTDGNVGLPKSARAKTWAGLTAPVLETRLSDTIALVRLFDSPFPADSHNVSYFLIIVVPSELAQQKGPEAFTLEELIPMDDGTPDTPWIAAKYGSTELPKTLQLGDDTYLSTDGFRNRPLDKERSYRVFVRTVYTDERSVSSPYSEELTMTILADTSSSDMQLLMIVAPICAVIVLFLLIVLAVVFVRRSKRARRTKRLPAVESPLLWPVKSSMYDPMELQKMRLQTQGMASHPPIPVHELAKHIEDLKDNDRKKFSQEYESIEPGQQFTWDASNQEINKTKNRYANVVAYDHSRVILQVLDGIPGSDYINANFVDGRRNNTYIATQGPLPDTFGDFWRMIWEQRCQTIVMMTKLEERNRIKCDQYWPNRGTEVYGLMQVSIIDVIELASYTVRTFVITKNNSFEKREVRQFQFTAWPDHGVPDHPTPLLTFVRRVKGHSAADVGPIVVHCSAGVGRTGAFIVIDCMLDRLQHEDTLDVYGYVTCLRAQRNYMVQTEDQYIFVHEALLEAVQSGNTEIPADSLYMRIQHLTQIDPQHGVSHMELEFRKISETKSTAECINGGLSVNKSKNRLVNILPYDYSRVCLQSIRGVEGSDYINASFIDGYRNRRSYIATQSPFPETTEDFWRMLWENNCTIIVMLTKLVELGREKCHQYWPDDRSARYQYFVVDPVGQYTMPQFVLREFKVTDARDGQSRMIRHFQFMDWPEQGVPSSGEGFIEFIGHIQKTREQAGQDGPIIVHCSTGFGRTGVFLTLSIVLEQMRYEGVVDMFQTVKMLRTQRPAMVQTEDQYTFCYRAALEYLSSFDHYAS